MLVLILSMIALLGLGGGIWFVASVASMPRAGPLDVIVALAAGSVPLLIGTVALGAVAIVLAIEKAARVQVAAVDRGTEAFINEARFAEHHQGAAGQARAWRAAQ